MLIAQHEIETNWTDEALPFCADSFKKIRILKLKQLGGHKPRENYFKYFTLLNFLLQSPPVYLYRP